jgi:hypothetical protein
MSETLTATQPEFTEPFGYTYDGATISVEIDGFTCRATTAHDDDSDPPWSRADGHGPVSDWTQRNPVRGEVVLNDDGGSRRLYDMNEAVKQARRESWGCHKPIPGETRTDRARRAAQEDFEHLKRWCDNEWDYCGVLVTVWRDNIQITGDYDHAMWGVERNCWPSSEYIMNEYLLEVANELLPEALADARARLKALCTNT